MTAAAEASAAVDAKRCKKRIVEKDRPMTRGKLSSECLRLVATVVEIGRRIPIDGGIEGPLCS